MTDQKAQGPRFSPEEIRKHIKKIQEATEKHRREHRHESFEALTPEEIEKKLKRVNSPMITSEGWAHPTAGTSFGYSVTIYNPDPTPASGVYVHVWVGSGNVDPGVGTFLLNVDPRFPRLTEPPVTTPLTLASGASVTLSFTIFVPASIEKSSYLGNACLMRLNWLDTGTYLDRGVFLFRVS